MASKPWSRTVWLVVGVVATALPGGCGSDAVAIEDCREIENARCEVAMSCGDRFEVTDVDSCKRFYRLQCLHGMTASKGPTTAQLKSCVSVIQAAGRCAASAPTTPLADCGEPTLAAQSNASLVVTCDVIEFPEYTAECAFLTESTPTDAGTTASEETDASLADAASE